MMFDLPSHDTLYAALLARDPAYDGRAYVCVGTTGIFCRLTCPARKPKSENCTFVATIGDCIEGGYRACKRCHPLAPAAEADPAIAALLQALDERPDIRWSERHITQMGFDLSTVRRSFKRQFGMTFLEMARQRRLREGFEVLRQGERVIDAQHSASFESASAFRTAFARLLGCAPNALKQGGLLRADWFNTPLGDMIAVSSASHLHLLEFVERKALPRELSRLRDFAKGDLGFGRYGPTDQVEQELTAFFAGTRARFDTPMAFHGSAFTKEVWHALCAIPAGETRTYAQLAQSIARPTATRAAARANGANQLAILVPCHRILGADGALTGYGGGLWRKQKLIEIEQQYQPMRMDG
ncbi:bifunctional transcriptional activator/DNA repair enzyme AdaA [Shimia marina]|uniref:methylated-DNA--[protein]-cysteine S-methyltransferase n=1 Tax=Shimia marina TaxID=321267 RepID=A0A0P1EJQ0_9RHOB|nr:trifunctional transcriptional activator/DNA repair protein Ada/methylated-DNA--[protein]-cysteine S-methyltransferase [Shimia marina]CUH50760.1 Regulatory protein of adaptative response [Shimia marina]SFE34675.1 AraC family transcriptional regulator, regulatory protein of adaptative response / methylated-DNA-[protein]-cysteine methyltransferase [Shimia marina]